MKKVMMMLAALVAGVALFMGARYLMKHEKAMKNNVKIQAELDSDMDNEENEEVAIQSQTYETKKWGATPPTEAA